MNLANTTKTITKSPWLYTLGVSVAALINSHVNAQKSLKAQNAKTRALSRIAKVIEHNPKTVKIKGHIPKNK